MDVSVCFVPSWLRGSTTEQQLARARDPPRDGAASDCEYNSITMAAFRKTLSDELITFIQAQPIYFTASGTGSGRINLSPKGVDSFRVLDPQTVGYMDLTGSGNETSAHLLADGRLTIMFCSFGEKPLILRLYGRGRVIRPDAAEWAMYRDQFPAPGPAADRAAGHRIGANLLRLWRSENEPGRPARHAHRLGEETRPRGRGGVSAEEECGEH
jgi:hypothetical protein